jgi:hypothetical protein
MALASGSPHMIRAVLKAAQPATSVRKKFRDDPASVPLGATGKLYIMPQAHIGTLFHPDREAVQDDSALISPLTKSGSPDSV